MLRDAAGHRAAAAGDALEPAVGGSAALFEVLLVIVLGAPEGRGRDDLGDDRVPEPARALCDILAAVRIEDEVLPFDFTRWQELKSIVGGGKDHRHALKVLKDMQPLHFPVAFPEVFLRERAGFDVILGNPPWEEATLEEDAFWARHCHTFCDR